MKLLLQRVTRAQVSVGDRTTGAINQGLLVFAGFEPGDDESVLVKMADKLLGYRIFADDSGKMNLSVSDIYGGVLVVSQFTLAADTRKGLRPGFSYAANPDKGLELYRQFIRILSGKYAQIEQGEYGADMQVSLVNDGPVTIWLESR